MIIDLVDGTYELFRHFYGLRRFTKGEDRPYGAVAGVLNGVLEMIEREATHVGVATDHVIESFRNRLWPGYKTGAGIEPALLAQFHPLEQGLAAMGVAVWPMIELEADDALASAGDAAAIREKFGVEPALIPDFLALVGDAADGYPGIEGIGAVGAARLLNLHGPIEDFPPAVLGERREAAMLFKQLATLRTDAKLFGDVEELRWRGPTAAFAAWTESIGAPKLLERCLKALSAADAAGRT